MLEPLKNLNRLWDKIEKSGISRKRKDFLLTVVALAMTIYVLALPILVMWLKQVTDMIQKAFGL